MKNLIKYEFRKTLSTKLLVLGAAAVLELCFLIGLYADIDKLLGLSTLFLTMLAFGGVMVIGLASVVILHRDMNTKQSYMLFMTPNSSYKILGAKVLENGLSILLAGLCFFALGALDIALLFARQGQLSQLWEAIQEFLHRLDSRIVLDMPTMLTLTLNILATWISFISCAYLGVVVSTALLNGQRGNGFISFLLIIALLSLTSFIQVKATESIYAIRTVFLAEAGIALALSALMYFLTARIMDHSLSV